MYTRLTVQASNHMHMIRKFFAIEDLQVVSTLVNRIL